MRASAEPSAANEGQAGPSTPGSASNRGNDTETSSKTMKIDEKIVEGKKFDARHTLNIYLDPVDGESDHNQLEHENFNGKPNKYI